MASVNASASISTRDTHRERLEGYPAGGYRFDLTFALISAAITFGMYQDAWAHYQGRVDDTFFTPWHAILYSGIALAGLFLVLSQYRNVGRGYRWSHALPRGYLPSLFGVLLFFVGGATDLIWHELFGFEIRIELLLSPPHLILACAGTLIVTGPIRAMLSRRQQPVTGWRTQLPLLIALFILLSLMTFFVQYANIFVQGRVLTWQPDGDSYYSEISGITYVIFPTVATMILILFAIRRWRLPFGALTVLLTGNATANILMNMRLMLGLWWILIGPLAAGLLGDLLLRRLDPLDDHRDGLRVFAFVVPVVLYGLPLALLDLQSGIFLSLKLWLGATLVAGLIGVALSYLAFPPVMAPEDA